MRLILIVAGLAAAAPARAAILRETAGLVMVRRAGVDAWRPARRAPLRLASGDSVRTGFNARVVVSLDGGAVLEAAGNTQFALEESRTGTAADLVFGSLRLRARDLGARMLTVRAPTATARVRSLAADWSAAVSGGGNALFEVRAGLLGVEGAAGGAMLLRAGERVEADLAGLHEPSLVPTPERALREDFAARMRAELSEDLERGAVQELAGAELRRQEHELGRVLTDASGDRVRAEEFVVRAAPDRFEFVALNQRRGAGLSWYSWTGTFDAALPADLAPVFQALPGSVGAPAPWTLTSFTATRSNGVDVLTQSAAGGHQVDLNANADPADDVAALFDPAAGAFVSTVGRPVYRSLFDRGGLYADGVLKRGWTGTNLQAMSDAIPASASDPLTGAALAAALPSYTSNATAPDGSAARVTALESYSDGTALTSDERAVAPGGGVTTRDAFGPATSGTAYQAALLRQGFELTTAATEFGGRTVDVLVSPRVLIETGTLP